MIGRDASTQAAGIPSQATPTGLLRALRSVGRVVPAAYRRRFPFVVLLMLAGGLAELAAIGSVLPFLSLLAGDGGWAADALQRLGAGDRRSQIALAAILFAAAAVLAAAIRLWLAWASQRFVVGVGHELSVEVQRRILDQPYDYHVRHNSSEVVALVQMVEIFTHAILAQLMQSATAVLIGLAIAAFLIGLDPGLAALAAGSIAAAYAVVALATRRRLKRNSDWLETAFEERVRLLQESSGAIRDIIIEGSQAQHVAAFRKADWRLARAEASNMLLAITPRFVIEAAATISIAVIALAAVGPDDSLAAAIPTLGALALAAQRLLPLVQQLYHGWSSIAGQRSVITRVEALLALPLAERDPVVDPLPFRSSIVLESVRFAYPGVDRPAIGEATFTIHKGERVALVGRTGSGKSTLADLLMGLIEPQAGSIAVDGVRLEGRSLRRWRRCVAHVPQMLFLADTSIARNIAFGSTSAPDPDRLRAAAAAAHIHAFIETLPDGYETRIGEGGIRLSGGQRQRLAIARAFYRDLPFLVLDEATSALDEDSERDVLAALDDIQAKGKTILLVTHRQSALAGCDRIVSVVDGVAMEMPGAGRRADIG